VLEVVVVDGWCEFCCVVCTVFQSVMIEEGMLCILYVSIATLIIKRVSKRVFRPYLGFSENEKPFSHVEGFYKKGFFKKKTLCCLVNSAIRLREGNFKFTGIRKMNELRLVLFYALENGLLLITISVAYLRGGIFLTKVMLYGSNTKHYCRVKPLKVQG
jgi:hypothetical protein